MFCGLFKAEVRKKIKVHARKKQYANMLLDINGKMVRSVHSVIALCVRV